MERNHDGDLFIGVAGVHVVTIYRSSLLIKCTHGVIYFYAGRWLSRMNLSTSALIIASPSRKDIILPFPSISNSLELFTFCHTQSNKMVVFQSFQAVIIACLMIGVAFSVPIFKRDSATVLSDLKTISKNLETLDSNILKFDGTRSKAVPLSESASAVMRDLDKTIIDTNKSAAFEPTDSVTVTKASAALEPTILRSLNDISAKVSVLFHISYHPDANANICSIL